LPSALALTGYFLAACFVVFLLVWIIAAFSTKRTVRRSGRWRGGFLLITAVSILVARLTRGTGAAWVVHPLWPHMLAIALVGDALAFAGLVLMLWARFTLGRNWSASVVLKHEHELIVRGPYRLVRHPIYSGGILMMLGWVVWSGLVVSVIAWLFTIILFWFKAGEEERLLTEHFGNSYRDYKSRVKGLIPYVL